MRELLPSPVAVSTEPPGSAEAILYGPPNISASRLLAGGCSSSADALVLFAMAYVTNISYIQAFRQMSLPLGFFAGILILKEKGTIPKVLGMLLIVAGLLCVSFG